MKFLALNKKRHAIKQFNGKPVDFKDLRTAIEIAQLAPSAHNLQPWKFVVVEAKKEALVELANGVNNAEQIRQAHFAVLLFTDTDLEKRARKVARIGGAKNFSEEQLQKLMINYPAEFARYSDQQKSDYLAFNAGLVAMNFVLALTDQGIASNMLFGFKREGVNELLDIDSRFRPEVLITVGYSDDRPEPSYRLPVDETIERR